MPSILDQLDKYYATKRPAAKSGGVGGAVTVPVSLRHPNADEFFQNLMLRQKSGSANNNCTTSKKTTQEKSQLKESALVSA